MRLRLALPAGAVLIAACNSGAPATVQTRNSATPEAHVSASESPDRSEVAIPVCYGEPEVRPDYWTSYCADAGQMFELVWEEWGPDRAVASGSSRITKGEQGGTEDLIRMVLERPVRVPEFEQMLFSRATVTYLDGEGPQTGGAQEEFLLDDMWRTGIEQRAWTPPPCNEPDGINHCAPDVGDPHESP